MKLLTLVGMSKRRIIVSELKPKPMSHKLKNQVIKLASEICLMHGSVAGDRICQDWSNEEKQPSDFLSHEEMCLLEYNSQCWNQDWDGYTDGDHWFHDEMSASFSVSKALELIAKDNDDLTSKVERLTEALDQTNKLNIKLINSHNEKNPPWDSVDMEHCMLNDELLNEIKGE